MAVGFASAVAQALLNAFGNATAYTGSASLYVQLHTGDPGPAGTALVASNNTRKLITMGAASGGAMSNDSQAEWTNVPAAEDYTHVSIWDALTAGTFQMSGTITANAVAIGDTFQLPIGDIDASLAVAA